MKSLLIAVFVFVSAIANATEFVTRATAIGDTVAPVVLDRSTVSDAPVGQMLYDLSGYGGFFALSPAGTWLRLASGSGNSIIRVTNGAGAGTTNTAIRTFSTVVESAGKAITYTSSASLGDYFTINETGMYSMYYSDSQSSGAGSSITISRNSNQLTTAGYLITNADILGVVSMPPNQVVQVSASQYLDAGDVIRAHIDPVVPANSTANSTRFTIMKISN